MADVVIPAPETKNLETKNPEKPRRIRKIAIKTAEVVTFMAVIERAIANPDISIDKLERLLAWLDAENVRLHAAAYNAAMAAAQAEMEPIRADCRNDQTHSRYASYAALNGAVRPIYTKYGFSLSFDTEPGPQPEQVRVFCTVRNGAHAERHQIDMPVDGKGARGGDVMTKTHAMGSGVTYGRRYLVGMIFDLAVTKDDDGNAASWQQLGVPAQQVVNHAAGRPPNTVASPAAKLTAEMAAVAAAKPAGMQAAIADMTPAIPALTPRRRDGTPPEPPPLDRIPDGPWSRR